MVPNAGLVDGEEYYSADEEEEVVTHALATPRAAREIEPRATHRLPKLPMLPLLEELSRITPHIRLAELLFLEAGVEVNSLRAKTHFAASLPGEARLLCLSLIYSEWASLTYELFTVFGNGNVVREDLEKRLSALSFSPARPSEFVHRARTIYNLIPEFWDKSTYAMRIFSAVPRNLLKEVIMRARAVDPIADWRLTPFDTLLAYLADAVITASAVDEIVPSSGRMPRPDKVNQASDTTAQRQGKPWLEDWAKTHQGRVWWVRPPSGEPDANRLKAVEIKKMRSRQDGRPYWWVAFKSESEAEAGLALLPEGSVTRRFKPLN
jgi:hypothetical protein